ncbi:ABC transporter permease [Azospirillum formosense]|uniref:ABC transporter permease n=1 Tax=Azospirillum formosense TaxID=861533 RepID=A0ABX2KSC8_9PROT|nr:ABC transporter permease [Azospirillum formosense]MBY3757677.1 ABC transporter permease [Azospirillum formosense]NUB19538.1 ABC transporter permease [Azospirillum formosense]
MITESFPGSAARRKDGAVYDSGDRSEAVRAWDDLREGAMRWRLWSRLGWHDIRKRYRRSVLGPFWLTLSMAVMVASLGLIYGTLFRLDLEGYLPFLAVGLATWTFIASFLNEGCISFIELEPLIKNVRIPMSLHILRALWRNLIIYGHNIVIFAVVAAIFGIWPGATGLLAVAGLALLLVNAGWIMLLLGMICTRFRDVPPIIASVIQLLFFVTPVMWKPELLGDRRYLMVLNPFYHLLEVIRAPLLGHAPGWESWVAGLLFAAVGWAFTFACFARFRKRIAYWL